MSHNVDQTHNDQPNGRRQFLAWGAAMGGLAIAPGITLFDLAHGRPPEEPASARCAGAY